MENELFMRKKRLMEEYEREVVEVTKKVIDELNFLTGKKFSPDSVQLKKVIRGRLKDGYTLEDLLHVVRIKVYEWNYNDEMNRYLRPKTLFRRNNFENYVNEKFPEDIERELAEIKRKHGLS